MKHHNIAAIMNVSSTIGLNNSEWDATIYVGFKFIVKGLTRAAAEELGKHNIRVNTLHPGTIHTPILAEVDPEVIEMIAKEIILSRAGEAEETTNMGVFLISYKPTYSTGGDLLKMVVYYSN